MKSPHLQPIVTPARSGQFRPACRRAHALRIAALAFTLAAWAAILAACKYL